MIGKPPVFISAKIIFHDFLKIRTFHVFNPNSLTFPDVQEPYEPCKCDYGSQINVNSDFLKQILTYDLHRADAQIYSGYTIMKLFKKMTDFQTLIHMQQMLAGKKHVEVNFYVKK